MAFAALQYFSRSLQKASSLSVVFPDDPKLAPPWSVFYLLHGLSDDHTIWTRRTSIERYVQDLPLMVVMPDGGRGFYTDAVEGLAHETDLIRDVVGLIERTFPVAKTRGGRCIGGLSMGGYGAIKLGLKYPDMFGSVTSHSGALGFLNEKFWHGMKSAEWLRVFGPNAVGGREDTFELATKADISRLPAMRIDCGTEDFLLDQNREFHAHLQALDIPHEYEESPGSHDWDYWDQHVKKAVAYHAWHLDGLRRDRRAANP